MLISGIFNVGDHCPTSNSDEMEVILVLIGVSLVVAGGFLAAFFWANQSGQFDDDQSPPIRILYDDDEPD